MYKRKGAKRSYRKKTVSKRKSTVSKNIKKYVNRTIHKNIENKCVQFSDDFSFASVNSNSSMYAAPLLPQTSTSLGLNVPQGVGQGGRTGNTIRTRKLVFRYVLTPVAYDELVTPQPQPCIVRLYFGFRKACRDAAPTAAQFSSFFQAGSFAEPFAGNLSDMIRPVNTDVFTVNTMRTHKIGNAFVATATTNPAADQQYTNNDYKLNAMGVVDLTKYCPKVLKFNDTTNLPDTGLYVWFNSVYAVGSQTVDNTYQTRCYYNISYEYEDA